MAKTDVVYSDLQSIHKYSCCRCVSPLGDYEASRQPTVNETIVKKPAVWLHPLGGDTRTRKPFLKRHNREYALQGLGVAFSSDTTV